MRRFYQWEKKMILKLSQQTHPVLDWLMLSATRMGNGGLVWILIGLVLVGFGYVYEGLLTITALTVTAVLINLCIKPLFTRKRPYEILQSIKTVINPPFGSSFPSGHAASSFAAASMLWLMNVPFKYLALLLACLIAVSRVYLFVHFPSDVLVGMISGILLAYLTYQVALKMGGQAAEERAAQILWQFGQYLQVWKNVG